MLVATEAFVGPVALDFTSIASDVRSSVQPDGGPTEIEKYLVVSIEAVGQFVALIEPVPVAAMRAGARVRLDAVTPAAFEVAGVETCDPGSLARLQVASTPEKAIVQLPDGGGSVPVVHTDFPLADGMHV